VPTIVLMYDLNQHIDAVLVGEARWMGKIRPGTHILNEGLIVNRVEEFAPSEKRADDRRLSAFHRLAAENALVPTRPVLSGVLVHLAVLSRRKSVAIRKQTRRTFANCR
jgi:hypothetical protein